MRRRPARRFRRRQSSARKTGEPRFSSALPPPPLHPDRQVWTPASTALLLPAMAESKPLDGKLALVTGASRGIGAATAEALAAAGAHVILVARTPSALEEVEDRIHQAGGTATIAPLDLTEGESIGKLAVAVAERWGKLEVLVLNAAFDPLLKRADKADVVALTSSVGAEPRAFWGAYGSSKAALETLLGAYADETEHMGRLRVHIVDPGATRTRMRALAFPGEEPDSIKPPEVVADAIVERLIAETSTGEKIRVDA